MVGVPTSDNLIDLFHSVIPPYRKNAFWLMADSLGATIRKLKDTRNQYLWEPGLRAEDPSTSLGKPVVFDANGPASGTGVKSILFGEFSAYYTIRDVRGLRFERSDDYASANDLITFRAIMRSDGQVVDVSGAVRSFRGGTP